VHTLEIAFKGGGQEPHGCLTTREYEQSTAQLFALEMMTDIGRDRIVLVAHGVVEWCVFETVL